MTIKEVIDYVDAVKPNAFDNETKTVWLNDVEGYVQTEVFLLNVDDVTRYSYDSDKNKTMLVVPPHDKVYRAYLEAMIDFENGEYNKYQNTMQMYNAWMGEYMRWFARTYRPADRR